MSRLLLVLLAYALCACRADAAEGGRADVGSEALARYFARETAALRDGMLSDVTTLDDWRRRQPELRQQLLDMLGLAPLPEKTDLQAVVTGRVEREDFAVEKVHFQSRPGLYVTANLYLPKHVDQPLPAVLYVCGHGGVKKDGISYGNKVHYQHHGAWYARNGYACLTIDSLQLGEIEAIHHGTYRYDRWWWLPRGYTPAGVEAWNCVRALDYLATRPEVDMQRVGVTGRSGGGAYSWWIAAIDERIAAAVPVAGITDLENHVIDGAVEGHCDCMYMVNTYRWDYPQVAALVAPRPLLISNTDRDGIFPLEGVIRTHAAVRRVYQLSGAAEQLALQITAGGHQDTQELRIHSFRWFNHFLKSDDELIEKVATKYFEPEELRVFGDLPADEVNTKIDESFVPKCAEFAAPASQEQWIQQTRTWRSSLAEKTFRGWPAEPVDPQVQCDWSEERDGLRVAQYRYASQVDVELPLMVVHRAGMTEPALAVLSVCDGEQWAALQAQLAVEFADRVGEQPVNDQPGYLKLHNMLRTFPWVMAYVPPRGVGPTALSEDPAKRTQILRRYYLLGQSLDGMQVWDIRQAARALRGMEPLAGTDLWLQAHGTLAGVAAYAALYDEPFKRVDLHQPPRSHRHGPYLLNVQRFMDMPHAVALAAERSRVIVYDEPEAWSELVRARDALGWDPKQFQVRAPLTQPPGESAPQETP